MIQPGNSGICRFKTKGADGMKYMIELHYVAAELELYAEELKQYGLLIHRSDRYPAVLWLESEWDKEILEQVYGVKKVRLPIYQREEMSVLDET